MERNKGLSVQTIEIMMPTHVGFHLRVVAGFVVFVRQYRSTIQVCKGKLKADGKNVLGLLLLAAAWKSKLQITATGDDAEQTIAGIKRFFQTEKNLPINN